MTTETDTDVRAAQIQEGEQLLRRIQVPEAHADLIAKALDGVDAGRLLPVGLTQHDAACLVSYWASCDHNGPYRTDTEPERGLVETALGKELSDLLWFAVSAACCGGGLEPLIAKGRSYLVESEKYLSEAHAALRAVLEEAKDGQPATAGVPLRYAAALLAYWHRKHLDWCWFIYGYGVGVSGSLHWERMSNLSVIDHLAGMVGESLAAAVAETVLPTNEEFEIECLEYRLSSIRESAKCRESKESATAETPRD